MEPIRSAQSHLETMEHDMQAAFAPLGEIVNQSRLYMERCTSAMRDETLDLLTKLHDHNGAVLAEFTGKRDPAALMTAQERWLMCTGRDCYAASLRIHETARELLAESLEHVGAAMRNGNGNGKAHAQAGEREAA